MKVKLLGMCLVFSLSLVILACSSKQRSADVEDEVEAALSNAGLANLTVAQNRDKGVITLSGDVASEDDKKRASDVAQSVSQTNVIANEIGVRPVGFTTEAKQIDSSLDEAIEKNFEAALIARQMQKGMTYSAINGVLTIKGEVNSQEIRKELEKMAANVPNVKQAVNELQVKEQKATSTKY